MVNLDDIAMNNTGATAPVNLDSIALGHPVSLDDVATNSVDKSSLSYAATHPGESFGELGKDALLGLVGTRDKADWEHPLNYLSPWANKNAVDKEDVENAETLQKAGNVGLSIAAYMSGAGAAEALAGGAELGTIPTFLASNTAGSVLSQAENGDVSLKNTLEDIGTAGLFEGGMSAIARPAAKQIKSAYNSLMVGARTNPELKEAVQNYLAGSRVMELGKHMKVLKDEGKPATILDAFQEMYKEVPEMFEGEQYASLKNITKQLKNESSPARVIEHGKSIRDRWYGEAMNLAKDEAELRKFSHISIANHLYNKGLSTLVDIPDEMLADTLLQKIGKTLEGYMGVDLGKMQSILTSRKAIKELAPVISSFKKMVRKDNKRINLELQALEGKTGVSERAKYNALSRQRTLNQQMLSYIDNGLKGRKVKVSDLQQAIKSVQEAQFNTGTSKDITNFFQSISNVFEAMNVHHLEESEGFLTQVVKHYGLKGAAIGASALTGLGVPATAIALTATAAGKLSRMAKARNLNAAWEMLYRRIEAGDMTEEEAQQAIKAMFHPVKAKVAGRVAGGLREAATSD